MPKQKENQELSAWERRNLYAKQLLASRNKPKMNNTNSKTKTPALKSVENVDPQQNTKILSKKRIASTSASLLQETKRTKVELPPRVLAKATPRSKPMIKPRNMAEPLKVDSAIVRFTAKPIPLTKKSTVKRQTPTQRQSIVKRNTPRVSMAPSSINRKPNKYQVPSKIDTGLKKKIITKVKINDEAPAAIIQDLNNPIPGTSSGIFAAETCPTPAMIIAAKPITPASKPKVTKKRKISFGGKTNPRGSLRSGSTPILSAKRAKINTLSERKLRGSIIFSYGREIDTHLKKVKAINQSAQHKVDEDSEGALNIDAETLPELGEIPLTDEVFEPCTSVNLLSTPDDAAPIKKRSKSKSVSFKVPADTERIRTVLPRTPRNRPSLRTGLNDFAAEAGINTARIRHLHCLGVELSDLKKKSNAATNITPQSTPRLRVKPGKAAETSPVQPTEDDLNCALSELKESILKGMRPGLAENWLEEIQEFYPHYQVLSKFTFWECKALVEEKKGDFDAALEIYNEASNKVSENESELLQTTLGDFLNRAQLNDEGSNKENSLKKTPKPRRTGLDSSKIFDSKIVKFVSAKNANSVKKMAQPTATPNQIQSVFTPVRRSARLSARNPGKSGIDLEEISQDDLARTLFVPNSFLD